MPKQKQWFKLDNAATVFPGQNTSRWSNIFRFSVMLTEKIDPDILEQALADVMPRFPCYDVRIRNGLFWHYFEKNPNGLPEIQPDIVNPCHRVKFKENGGYLFRIYYYENRISGDFYHALTDGLGACFFVCTLAAQYLRLCGHKISVGGNVLDITFPATKEELEDPYKKCGLSKGRVSRGLSNVYHVKGTKAPKHMVNITRGIVSLDDVRALAKTYGATVTEFIGALLLFVHYEKQKQEKRKQKKVCVQIPVSLRKTFGIHTLRNFSLYYLLDIDPLLGDYTFEEVLKHIILSLRDINNEKTLRAMITANLKLVNSPFMRIMPLVVKDLAIGIGSLLTGEKATTVLFTNLGKIDLPEDMLQFVDCVEIMAGPGRLNAVRCGGCGLKDKFIIDFANIFEESDIEKRFFTALVKMGAHVKIESNRR